MNGHGRQEPIELDLPWHSCIPLEGDKSRLVGNRLSVSAQPCHRWGLLDNLMSVSAVVPQIESCWEFYRLLLSSCAHQMSRLVRFPVRSLPSCVTYRHWRTHACSVVSFCLAVSQICQLMPSCVTYQDHWAPWCQFLQQCLRSRLSGSLFSICLAVSKINTFIGLLVTCHGPGRKELTELGLPWHSNSPAERATENSEAGYFMDGIIWLRKIPNIAGTIEFE